MRLITHFTANINNEFLNPHTNCLHRKFPNSQRYTSSKSIKLINNFPSFSNDSKWKQQIKEWSKNIYTFMREYFALFIYHHSSISKTYTRTNIHFSFLSSVMCIVVDMRKDDRKKKKINICIVIKELCCLLDSISHTHTFSKHRVAM